MCQHLVAGLKSPLLQFEFSSTAPGNSIRFYAAAALTFLVVQLALGGWVSANYAALACPDLPLCRGKLLPGYLADLVVLSCDPLEDLAGCEVVATMAGGRWVFNPPPWD